MKARLGEYAPTPLVGAVALLLILVILTPALISSGQTPGITTQALLVVDRYPGTNLTWFYVHAAGSSIRYANVWVAVATNVVWDGTGIPNWTALAWTTFANESNVVDLQLSALANPVGLNVTAYYRSTSGSAIYTGLVVFWAANNSNPQTLYWTSPTSGVGSGHQPYSGLPYPIALSLSTSGRLP